MSATLNADLFARYFSGGKGDDVPIIEIPGRTFPVEQIFLENAIDLVDYAIEEGSQYAKKISRKDKEDNGQLAKEMFKGGHKALQDVVVDDWELRDAMEDNSSYKQVKDSLRDEQLSAGQIEQRYGGCCSDLALGTLSLMDFDKIDYDLIEATLVFIAEGRHNYPREGAILVFLPGMQEIMSLYDQIANHPVLGLRAGRFKLIPLHSSLSTEEQSAVFDRPGRGKPRKIVISTNLAETSITIDDCVFVVDAGRMKEKRFDSNRNMESLDTVWVSKANSLQRKGRAGRVMAGVCFHLYTQFRYDRHFRKDPIPEIQRVPLEQMVLRIKILPLFKVGWTAQ